VAVDIVEVSTVEVAAVVAVAVAAVEAESSYSAAREHVEVGKTWRD